MAVWFMTGCMKSLNIPVGNMNSLRAILIRCSARSSPGKMISWAACITMTAMKKCLTILNTWWAPTIIYWFIRKAIRRSRVLTIRRSMENESAFCAKRQAKSSGCRNSWILIICNASWFILKTQRPIRSAWKRKKPICFWAATFIWKKITMLRPALKPIPTIWSPRWAGLICANSSTRRWMRFIPRTPTLPTNCMRNILRQIMPTPLILQVRKKLI